MRKEITPKEALLIYNAFSTEKKIKIHKRALKKKLSIFQYEKFMEKLNSAESDTSSFVRTLLCEEDTYLLERLQKKLKKVCETIEHYEYVVLTSIKHMIYTDSWGGDDIGFLYSYKFKSSDKKKKDKKVVLKDSYKQSDVVLMLQQYGDYVCNNVLDRQKPIYMSSKEWLEKGMHINSND